jgi:prepilin-type N-terminal cleavage/methylation domain-containing protein
MKKTIIKEIKGFTLIEILVVISIIAILALWIVWMDFNRLSWKQKTEIFWNKIVSNMETIINNALLWKWIWVNLNTPKQWKIEISTTNSWTLKTSYLSWSLRYNYEETSLNTIYPYSISNIYCIKLDGSTGGLELWNSTWTILIKQAELSLSWCEDDNFKILKFDTSFLDNKKTIDINTLNGIIKKY